MIEKMKKRIPFLGIILVAIVISTNAQEAVISSGGEALGSGGTASYTIGQLVYTTHSGTSDNSLAQGLQQAYEISVISGLPKAADINISVSAYPNPTIDFLTIKVEHYKTTNLKYLVFDINGRLLQIQKALGQETKIETNNLVNGSYFVKVMDNNNEIKVFKIVKN